MSEAVVRAERELLSYVVALQEVLRAAVEDALPQSMWEGESLEMAGDDNVAGSMPDTLQQQLERETALEKRRIDDLVRRRLVPQRASLCAAVAQLGGGFDANGSVVDVPVEVLDRDIAAAAAESAEQGRRMVELYDEAALLASTMEAAVMSKSVPSL